MSNDDTERYIPPYHSQPDAVTLAGVTYRVEVVSQTLIVNGRRVDYLIDHNELIIRLTSNSAWDATWRELAWLRAVAAAAQTMPEPTPGSRW